MITAAGMRPRFYEKEQNMQKNDIVTADIEDIGVNGEGIGKVDGYTLFIKDAVIGDRVEVKVMKAKRTTDTPG